MGNVDIRWQQGLANYQKALGQLTKFIEKGELSELEEQGLIKAFEYTYDLAWNVLKDFLADQDYPLHQRITREDGPDPGDGAFLQSK